MVEVVAQLAAVLVALVALVVEVLVDHFQLAYQLLALPIQVEEVEDQPQYKM